MKRKFIITVLIALMAVICMSVAACHTHEYEDRVVPPTCTEDGYTEHECACGDSYRDNEIAARHTLNLVPEKTATCTEEGHSEYYECSACNKWFSDGNGQNEITDKDSVVISTLAHNLNFVPEKAPTCTEEGVSAYYICSACNKWFSDETGKSEITDKDSVILSARHTLNLVPEKAATCTEEGNNAYYVCSACDKWFEDENGQNEITDKDSVVISKIPHSYVDCVCTQCGRKQPTEGLEYTKIDGKEEYAVSGIGTATETDIVIPEEYNGLPVTSIYYRAFDNCRSLLSVTILGGITSIDSGAFDSCTGLTEVTLPDSITSMGSGVFDSCSSLTYNIKENLQYLGNSGNPYLCLMGVTSEDITEATIDGNCKVIAAGALSDVNITDIKIPNSVVTIGDFAFWYCYDLKSVRIGKGVTSIGNSAFSDCAGLTSIVIPNSIISIGNGAFANCLKLKSAIIGDGITTIGNGAFYNCFDLTYNIKDNLKYLGSGNNPYLCLMGTTSKDITNAEIDDNCKIIANSAFYDCINLTSVTIGSDVTGIGQHAFEGCNRLTSVYYKGTEENWKAISIAYGNNRLKDATKYYYFEI